MENHYTTLGVAENATPDEIKKAYRKLASSHHPDKGGDAEKFKAIQVAYDTIGDATKRAEYDHIRKFGGQAHQQMHGMPPDMADILRGFGFGDGMFRRTQPRRNKDIQVVVTLTLEETLAKTTKNLVIQTTSNKHSVSIDIPRGVPPGGTIKYPGLGDDFIADLPRGDLYIRISISEHKQFHTDGINLWMAIDINCLSAIIGSSARITSLDGTEFELTIPPGTQHNTKFKIQNQGLYAPNQSIRGSLYVIANIVIPKNLPSSQIETIKQLITS